MPEGQEAGEVPPTPDPGRLLGREKGGYGLSRPGGNLGFRV